MTLIEQCMCLPYWERVNLCAALQGTIARDRHRELHPGRGKELLDIMAGVIGRPVVLNSRDGIMAWAKTMVAYELSLEGFPVGEIARILEKDHSTVSAMKARMRDALTYPQYYTDIIDKWTTFQSRIHETN